MIPTQHPVPWFIPAVIIAAAASQNLNAGELRGKILDCATGKPLPARVYVRSSTGKWHFVKSASKDGSAIEYRKSRGPKIVEIHPYGPGDTFFGDETCGF